ncbi:YagK/YfjJ domain-containing protein [Ferrimonas senticii]|uniref:YagK/YfjJ domain-containing protein n=1 Tax=Ferrimonas senticii TaxID=394566 RepID=UPI0004816BB9|nr:inovirus-type Gp2 protein [Ferrimonas senticii]
MTTNPFVIHDHYVQPWVHQGLSFPIYGQGNPLSQQHKRMLKRLLAVINHALTQYSKVFVVRVEVAPHVFSADNTEFSDCLKQQVTLLQQQYGCSVYYAWVREHGQGTKHHYHLALLLSGHKIQCAHSLIEQIREIPAAKFAHFHLPECCYYQLHRGNAQDFMAAFYRLSYLAKSDTKIKAQTSTNNFGCNVPVSAEKLPLTFNVTDCPAPPATTPLAAPAPAPLKQTHCAIDFLRMKIAIGSQWGAKPQYAYVFVGMMAESQRLFASAQDNNQLNGWLAGQQQLFRQQQGYPRHIHHRRFSPTGAPEYQWLLENWQLQPHYRRKQSDDPLMKKLAHITKPLQQHLKQLCFTSMVELQRALDDLTAQHNSSVIAHNTRQQRFALIEQPYLMRRHHFNASGRQPTIHHIKTVKVGIDSHVCVQQHLYSVPAQYRKRALLAVVYDNRIEIYDEQQLVCRHQRRSGYGYNTDEKHLVTITRQQRKRLQQRFIKQATGFHKTASRITRLLAESLVPEQTYRTIQRLLARAKAKATTS